MKALRTALLLLIALTAPDAAAAAQVPPAPRAEPVGEHPLPGGGRLLVLPAPDEPPFALLVSPAGAALDPVGREGRAELLADVLGDTVSGVRADAAPDGFAIELVADDPLAALERLLEAPLADSRVAAARAARTEGLGRAELLADAQAALHLERALFPASGYRQATAASVSDVTAADVRALRDRLLDGAWLAVGGDVEPERVRRAAAALFERRGGGREAVEGRAAPDAAVGRAEGAPGLLLVDRPGSRSAVIHLGQRLPPGDHPDWPALAVLDLVLGGGAEGWLFRVGEPPVGAGADADPGLLVGGVSASTRRRGPGLFRVRAAVEPSLADDALAGLRETLEEAGRRLAGPADLARSRDLLRATVPGADAPARERARWRAAEVLRTGTAATPDEREEELRRLGPIELRSAARRHLRPERAVAVVVADLALLPPELRARGRVVEPIGAGADEARDPGAPLPLDGPLPSPVRLTYRVRAGDRVVGSAVHELRHPADVPDLVTWRTTGTVPGGTVEQTLTFRRSDLRPERLEAESSSGGRSARRALRRDGDRLLLVDGAPGAGTTLDGAAPAPPGALLSDQIELVLAGVELSEGARWRVPVVLPAERRVGTALIEVTHRETVEGPHGPQSAWVVEVAGPSARTLWLSADAPHLPLRIRPRAQPIVLELVREEALAGG